MADDRTARIGVLLLPKFSFAELGLVTEPLFIANWLLGQQRFQWQLLSLQEGPVMASNGLSMPAELLPDDNRHFDIIFILASFELKLFAENDTLKTWLRQAAGAKTVLCGIEGGTEALAAAGLLHGCRAAVHWDNLDGFQELYPDVDACLDLYANDARRMSCAGGTAVLDLMFHWMRPRLERSIYDQLKHHLLETRARAGNLHQGKNATETHEPVHPLVQHTIDLMREAVEEPVQVGDIASHLGISVRQLERHFRRELQISPSKYYLHLRMARAHRLLQQTQLPISEVATAAGFQSLAHFSRIYRQYYGCAPSQDRLQTIQAPAIPRQT